MLTHLTPSRSKIFASLVLALIGAQPAAASQYSFRVTSVGLAAAPSPAAEPAGTRLSGPVNFTSCGNSGRFGPALAQCLASYSGQSELLSTMAMPGYQGYQEWTVPATGNYTITAAGAGGGKSSNIKGAGGRGAVLRGSFDLVQGTVLQIVVGQAGIDAQTITYGSTDGGGGGGTFVVKKSGNIPLVVAGGGGGGNYYLNGSTTYFGVGGDGATAPAAANPPASTGYNSTLNFAEPGAGFAANGAMPGWGSTNFTVAMGFNSGAVGGISTNATPNRFGGFGGGAGAHGSSCIGGGAGGGYAGGVGAMGCGGGGGGSSYFDSSATARASSDAKYGATALGGTALGYTAASTPGYVTITQN